MPRPGPVRAARAIAGRRQFLPMNSNEGRWSIRLISIPSFGRSMCVPVGRSMSHESAGEREYFRRPIHFALVGPRCGGYESEVDSPLFQKRGSLNLAFRPAKPGLIAQQGCHLRWPLETFRCVRDRMSYSFIANTGDAPPMSRLGTRRAYDQSYAAIKNWGQYELVSSPSDADLVFEVSLVGQFEQYGNTLRLASRCSRPRSWSGNGSQHSAARAADPRR